MQVGNLVSYQILMLFKSLYNHNYVQIYILHHLDKGFKILPLAVAYSSTTQKIFYYTIQSTDIFVSMHYLIHIIYKPCEISPTCCKVICPTFIIIIHYVRIIFKLVILYISQQFTYLTRKLVTQKSLPSHLTFSHILKKYYSWQT